MNKYFKDICNPARQGFCPAVSSSVSKLSLSVLGLLSCSLLLAICLQLPEPVSDTFLFGRSFGLSFLLNLPLPLGKVKENSKPDEKERYAPPERKSVRDQLRRLQAESRQIKPKHRTHDRERQLFTPKTIPQSSIKGKTPLLQIRGSGVFLFALVLTEGNSLEQNKRALSYEQLNTPFALSSLVLNVEISCNRFHDFILSLHFSQSWEQITSKPSLTNASYASSSLVGLTTNVPAPWKRGAFAFPFILLPCTTHFNGVVTLVSSSQCVTSLQ